MMPAQRLLLEDSTPSTISLKNDPTDGTLSCRWPLFLLISDLLDRLATGAFRRCWFTEFLNTSLHESESFGCELPLASFKTSEIKTFGHPAPNIRKVRTAPSSKG